MSALVMLSGGLDSTYALYKACAEYRKTIHVLHVNINVQSSDRGELEKKACTQIKDWFNRNFALANIEWHISPDVTPLKAGSFDAMWHSIYVIQFCGQYKIDTLYLGECKDDVDRQEPGGATLLKRMWSAVYDWEDAEQAYHQGAIKYLPKFPKLIRPGSKHYKSELINLMPHDLIGLTWSCRYPRMVGRHAYVRCGRCGACKERQVVDQEVKECRLYG